MKPLVFALLSLMAAPAAAQTSCDALWDQAAAADQAGDARTLAQLSAEARSGGCDFERQIALRAASAALADILERHRDDSPMVVHDLIDAEMTRIGARPWRASFALGQLAHQAGDRRLELEHLAATQKAVEMDAIDDPAAAPNEDQQSLLRRMFNEAYMLGVLNGARSADVSRAACPMTRGAEAEAQVRPILFETAKAVLTPQGADEIDDLLGCLRYRQIRGVMIIGHADERGDDDMNLRLSQARAEAVGAYLRERGYYGDIVAEGRGESEPFQSFDPGSLTRDEQYALDRRVEIYTQEGPR